MNQHFIVTEKIHRNGIVIASCSLLTIFMVIALDFYAGTRLPGYRPMVESGGFLIFFATIITFNIWLVIINIIGWRSCRREKSSSGDVR